MQRVAPFLGFAGHLGCTSSFPLLWRMQPCLTTGGSVASASTRRAAAVSAETMTPEQKVKNMIQDGVLKHEPSSPRGKFKLRHKRESTCAVFSHLSDDFDGGA